MRQELRNVLYVHFYRLADFFQFYLAIRTGLPCEKLFICYFSLSESD